MDNQFVFVSADGDSIGNKVARASLSDDVDALHDISSKIKAGNDLMEDFAVKHAGQVISSGGDEANFRIPLDAVEELESLRTDYSYVVGATLSMGVGQSISQANKALMVAKLNGKDQILQYTPEVDQQYQQAVQNENAGMATGEAKKIGDAYMKNEEQKPVDQAQPDEANSEEVAPEASPQDDHSDCPYCKEAAEELGEDDCPYCAEEGVAGVEGSTNDCPYCEEAHSEDEHQHDDNCPHCQELDNAKAQEDGSQSSENDAQVDPDALPVDQEIQADPDQQAIPGEMQSGDEEKPKESGSEEHKSPEEIMEVFDETHGDSSTNDDPSQEDQHQFKQDEDTGIAESGDGQEENVSRPDDFNEEIPQGTEDPNNTDGSQDPNYAEVMQDDLSNNQDDIQRERVGDIVRQALQDYKANKDFLEQAQAQSPEFYQASVGVIRAMIEMAKLLGFNGPQQMNQEAQPELGQEQEQMVSEQPDPANPFPVHPDNGGQPQDGSQSANGDKGDWNNPFPAHPDNGGAGGKPKGQ